MIFLVGADKGGVGKTTVCRALIDYLTVRGAQARIFDTEFPKGDLKEFYPNAEVIDFQSVRGQMRVFDEISPSFPTVVDIRAGVLSPILKTLGDSHFLDDVKSGQVVLCVLHVLGPSISSLNEVVDATRLLGGGASHRIVQNHVNDTEYDLAKDPRYADSLRALAPVTIDVPKLTELACERLQQHAITFTEFIRDDNGHSRMLRGYVRHWLESVTAEFDRVGIGRML